MAAGDVSSITISSDGRYADILLLGMGTGGTYAFGFGANNDPATGAPTIAFRVVDLSFDDAGNASTAIRFVYGTMQERLPYPTAQSIKEVVSGSDVTVRVWLHSAIFAKANTGAGNSGTAVTCTVLGSFYTKSGTPNNQATNFAVTNNSTLAYPKVCGQIVRPDFEKFAASYRVEGVFGHWSGQSGRPVRCVKYTMTDAHAVSVTATVLSPTIDSTFGDQVPVVGYSAVLNTNGFTQNDIVTLNYVVYPWIGDSASILDSTDGGATSVRPSPLYGPQKFIADPGGTYCQAIVAVNKSTGNDGTGVVSNVEATAQATPFLTIGAAFNAMRASNNAGTYTGGVARNNCGGGTMALDDFNGTAHVSQSFEWTGATVTVGTAPDCNLVIRPASGASTANVAIASRAGSGTFSLGLKVKLQSLNLTADSASGVVDPNSALAQVTADGCTLNLGTTASHPFFYRIGVSNLIRCIVTSWGQNMKEVGSINAAWGIVRGNQFNQTTTVSVGKPYVFVGNSRASTSSGWAIIDFTTGQVTPTSDNLVWCFNSISTSNTSGTVMTIGVSAKTQGCLFMQNLVENVNGVNPIVLIAGDGSTPTTPINHIMIWNNTLVGQRFNYGYCENGATLASTALRQLWSVKNNIFDNDNLKSDTFNGNSVTATRTFAAGVCTVVVTGPSYHNYAVNDWIYLEGSTPSTYNVDGNDTTLNAHITAVAGSQYTFTFNVGSDPGAITVMGTGPNPLRVGDWNQISSMDWSGNCRAQITGIGSPGAFMPNFPGIKTICPAITQGNRTQSSAGCTANVLGYIGFKNRTSYTGSSGTGGGDYSLKFNSNVPIQMDYLLPYDMNGKPRTTADPAGCYSLNRQRALLLAF